MRDPREPWSGALCIADIPKPVPPSNIPGVDEDCLIVAMVSEALEENPPGEEGNLKCLYIDDHPVGMPCVRADEVCHNLPKTPIEVKEEEKGTGDRE